jgi:hypothetical protein
MEWMWVLNRWVLEEEELETALIVKSQPSESVSKVVVNGHESDTALATTTNVDIAISTEPSSTATTTELGNVADIQAVSTSSKTSKNILHVQHTLTLEMCSSSVGGEHTSPMTSTWQKLLNDIENLRTRCFDIPMTVLNTPGFARGSVPLPNVVRSTHGQEVKDRTSQRLRPINTVTLLLAINGRSVGNVHLQNEQELDGARSSGSSHGGHGGGNNVSSGSNYFSRGGAGGGESSGISGRGGGGSRGSRGRRGITREDRVAYRSQQQRSKTSSDSRGLSSFSSLPFSTSIPSTSSSSSSSSSTSSSEVDIIATATQKKHAAYLKSLNGVADANARALDQLATTRQKKLRFDRSLIHAWGMFADQHIAANDFVIEYKGELVTIAECERRSKMYECEGRDDYIFRVDKEWFVDATMKGSMARFINHCCDPNCFTQIIKHKNQSKIIIYAKRDINPGEELSYDYKFPYEDEKIICNCGSVNCRGTMN